MPFDKRIDKIVARQDDSEICAGTLEIDLSVSTTMPTVISRARGNKRETAAPFTGT